MPTILPPSLLALSLVAVSFSPAAAQETGPRPSRVEFRLTSGRLMPTGNGSTMIESAGMSAAQVAWVVRQTLAFTATVGWARSRDVASATADRLDIFNYDVGAEVRFPHTLGSGTVTLRPFAGFGAGVRSYNYRHLTIDATHNLAAYGSLGGELGIGRVRLRMELRDYVSDFAPLRGDGASTSRNDLVVMAGLRLARR